MNDRCDREESESYIGSILNNSFSGAGGVSPRPRVVMLSLRFAVRLSRCLGAGAPGAGCWIEVTTSSEAAILVLLNLPRKEVIQPHLPVRLPCYDFTPLTLHTFGASPLSVGPATSGADDSGGVTGGVYKARERIHRGVLIRDY